MKKKIIFLANNNVGYGLTGGDRIFVELLKNWRDYFNIILIGSAETCEIVSRYNILGITTIVTDKKNISKNHTSVINLILHTIRRIYKGINCIRMNKQLICRADYVYSVSDFLPDLIPALYVKLSNPKIRWIAAFYFFAANPFSSDFPYKGFRLRFRGAIYFFSQKIAYFLINKYSDFIVLCNEVDKKVFVESGYSPEHIYTIYGGVDLSEANSVPTPKVKKYDGVYMARFHPQKGPLMAVKVWEELMRKRPQARLAMIGNGSEEKEVVSYIKKKDLKNNIRLFGFMDGQEKYKILKSSRIFIHSAIYETGGMAVAEGMAAELPVVAFDHEGFDYCYPKGIVRISPIGDTKQMAATILTLLSDTKKYNQVKEDAIELVREEWDWDKRSAHLYDKINNAFENKL